MDSKSMKRILDASAGTQLGAIIRCAYDLERDAIPRFCGKAVMTSDDYIMCNFIDRNGIGHMGAFVGSRTDFDRNVLGIALHCKLGPAERAMFVNTMNDWAGVKYGAVRGFA
jgi:hypothetical protein